MVHITALVNAYTFLPISIVTLLLVGEKQFNFMHAHKNLMIE